MGQARAKKRAELARTTALERGAKKWDKSVLREVLRSQAPPGVEAIATRYDPGAQEILIACDDGIVRRVSWQMMDDAEREQASKLVIPSTHVEHKADEFLQQAKRDQQAKLEAIQQAMREQREQLEQARQQHEQEQRQQRDAERGPDWELAAARCAEIEIAERPREVMCACNYGGADQHPSHKNRTRCPHRGVYAYKHMGHYPAHRTFPVLCEDCAVAAVPKRYTLDCDAE